MDQNIQTLEHFLKPFVFLVMSGYLQFLLSQNVKQAYLYYCVFIISSFFSHKHWFALAQHCQFDNIFQELPQITRDLCKMRKLNLLHISFMKQKLTRMTRKSFISKLDETASFPLQCASTVFQFKKENTSIKT